MEQGRLEHPPNRTRRGGAFAQRLPGLSASNQQGETPEQFPNANGSLVKVEKAFKKDPEGHHAAEQDDPHERAAFLQDFEHAEILGPRFDG
jgi:hypothetical protein